MSPFSADSKHPRVGVWVAAALLWCAAGLAQVVTTFTIMDRYSMPVDIVAGSDGAMWFSMRVKRGSGASMQTECHRVRALDLYR